MDGLGLRSRGSSARFRTPSPALVYAPESRAQRLVVPDAMLEEIMKQVVHSKEAAPQDRPTGDVSGEVDVGAAAPQAVDACAPTSGAGASPALPAAALPALIGVARSGRGWPTGQYGGLQGARGARGIDGIAGAAAAPGQRKWRARPNARKRKMNWYRRLEAEEAAKSEVVSCALAVRGLHP
mmetsp:Transcript_54420/g.158115  ORF Transcript_54420/g.158115 Transcript_54420/m.158115 type:complete len:182 (-) Transcript_54420:342-887(-)